MRHENGSLEPTKRKSDGWKSSETVAHTLWRSAKDSEHFRGELIQLNKHKVNGKKLKSATNPEHLKGGFAGLFTNRMSKGLNVSLYKTQAENNLQYLKQKVPNLWRK